MFDKSTRSKQVCQLLLSLIVAKIVLCFPKFSTRSILSMQLALRNIKYNWLLSDKYLSTFTDINGRALYQNGSHLKSGVLYLTKCSLTTSLTTRPIRRHKWLHALRLKHACNYTDDCVTAVYISMYTRRLHPMPKARRTPTVLFLLYSP